MFVLLLLFSTEFDTGQTDRVGHGIIYEKTTFVVFYGGYRIHWQWILGN